MSEQAPAAGDVVISRRDGDGHFEISVVPGLPQFSVARERDAIRHAHAFALKGGVSVWMAVGGGYIRMKLSQRQEN
jgi:hypothetical protein